MGTLIKFHLAGVSNQIDAQLIAHTDYTSFVVLKPKIDKLSLVFDIPKLDGEKVLGRLKDVIEPEYLDALKPAGRYTKRFCLHVGAGGQPVLIEAAPKAKSINAPPFFRMEFNPDRLGKGLSQLSVRPIRVRAVVK